MKPQENISTAVSQWLQYNRRHTERTQTHYTTTIRRFTNGLPKQVQTVDQITTADLQDYINSLLNRGLLNRTCNANLTVLKSFCRWLSEQYDIPNHTQKVKNLKEDPPVQRILTNEQYERVLEVLETVDPVARSILQFLGNTGLRATEFCELTWDCISGDGKRLILTGKGRKRRYISLNSTCQKILAKLKTTDSKGPVFSPTVIYKNCKTAPQATHLKHYSRHKGIVEDNQPIDRRLLYNICRKAAVSAGIQIFGPHALRHYFATALLHSKVPISFVSKLLGHSSIRTTESIYIHFQAEYLDGVTECLVKK